MNVYLFSDYLRLMNDGGVTEANLIADIKSLDSLPHGLLEVSGNLARACMLSKNENYFYIEWVKSPKCKDSVDYSDEIECPHCGYICSDSWEFEDEGEHKCEACTTLFSFCRNVSVSYSSTVTERNENILKLD